MVYRGNEPDNGELRLPKNIRQIGESAGDRRVYLEDYAVTYLHQIKAAVLLGEIRQNGRFTCYFVSGAIEVQDIGFPEEIWEPILREAKEYFDGKEMIGWYGRTSLETWKIPAEMERIYYRYFREQDPVLVLYDEDEEEEAVFLAEEGTLVKQRGFYIYYEKNQMMQDYMVWKNTGKSVEKELQVGDAAIRSFRRILAKKSGKKTGLQEKTGPAAKDARETLQAAAGNGQAAMASDDGQKEREEPEKKEAAAASKGPQESGRSSVQGPGRLAYGAGAFVLLSVFAIGISVLQNYDRMRAAEELSGETQSGQVSIQVSVPAGNLDTEEQTETWGNDRLWSAGDETAADRQEETGPAAESTEAPAGTQTAEASAGTQSAEVPAGTQSAETSVGTQAAGTPAGAQSVSAGTRNVETTEGIQTMDEENLTEAGTAAQEEMLSAEQAASHAIRAEYVIKEGDTLAEVCEMYYGSLEMIGRICEENGIEDPNQILPGQKIVLP